ncbi:MAG: hypothetical protein EXX96DRAFT_576596 [Benjaminiella poitrasii]|nr:MAG: hypothetical protein EXX96DRAFT_576596 [Benjaminiella poitrasii]
MSTTKKARVNVDYYEQPKTISYFEAIINTLRIDLDKEGADTSFSAPDLAYFTAHFLKFQIDHLGRDAAEKAKRHRKSIEAGVPCSLFNVRQFTTSSSLYHILKAAYKFKSDYRIVDWHFDSLEEIPTYMEMVKVIKQVLDKAGFEQSIPRVFFDASIDAHKKKKMTLLVEGLGGVAVKDISDATFIIYNEEQSIDRFHKNWRTVDELEDDQTFIHWIGLPDSYNVILPNENCVVEKEDKTVENMTKDQLRAPWHVKMNWIEDSVRYNEWMSPLDYMMVEKQQSQPKRKRSTVEQDMEDDKESTNSSKKAKTPEMTRKDLALQYMPVQKHEVIIPSYSAWFDLNAIHHIEIRGLPEFFNDKNKTKTPSVYKEYRDFMINTYRLNPCEYLTVTACRRNMTGDVCSIIRVHAFLEQWGLINYQIDPTAKPTAIGPPFEGQIKIVAELPSVLNEVDDTDASQQVTQSAEASRTKDDNSTETDTQSTEISSNNHNNSNNNEKNVTTASSIDLNLDLRVSIYGAAIKKGLEEKKKQKEAQRQETCTSCMNQSNSGYHYNTSFVCNNCYDTNKLPESTQKEDYKKKQDDADTAPLPEPWTEQEEMLLLEGLEMFPEDWNKVAKHVSTRTQDDCILHYLHLPVSDPRIDPEVKKLGLLDFDRKEDVDNPIMSVVAFLAANVNPKVAAASSHLEVTDDANVKDMVDDSDDVKLETKYNLIRTKMMQFSSRMSDFNEMERRIDEERRQLEKERFLIREEHMAIRNEMDKIYGHMFQVRQAKLLKEKQMGMQEELMPNDVVVRLPHEVLTPEERELQNQLKARYPMQYFQRQQALIQP